MGVDRSTFVIDREGDIVRIWHNVAFSDNYDEIMRIVRLLGG
jgi:peroxiredoxin